MPQKPDVNDTLSALAALTSGAVSARAPAVVPLKPWVPLMVGNDVVMNMSRVYLEGTDFNVGHSGVCAATHHTDLPADRVRRLQRTLQRCKTLTLRFLARYTQSPYHASNEIRTLLSRVKQTAGAENRWTNEARIALRIAMRYELLGREPEIHTFEVESEADLEGEKWAELVKSLDSITIVNWA